MNFSQSNSIDLMSHKKVGGCVFINYMFAYFHPEMYAYAHHEYRGKHLIKNRIEQYSTYSMCMP